MSANQEIKMTEKDHIHGTKYLWFYIPNWKKKKKKNKETHYFQEKKKDGSTSTLFKRRQKSIGKEKKQKIEEIAKVKEMWCTSLLFACG